MFSPAFLNVDTDLITDDLKNKGFYAFEQALESEFIEKMLHEIDFDTILLNKNDVGVVRAQDIKFYTHCLAGSKRAYDTITNEKILNICRRYFTDIFRLTNHRIYETSKNSYMPWHTDNNRQAGKKLVEKHNMPGLLFLVYLSDVEQNAFQFVKDSHKWSAKYSDEIYLSNTYVESKYGSDILTFKMKKGSIIISDINGIHRAEPFQDKNYKRTTLLFQVDQTGADNTGHGEKNIVNTEYLGNISPDLMQYLGFGFKRDYPAFPNSSLESMKTGDILNLQQQLLPQTLRAIYKNTIKKILPAEAIVTAKRLKWHFKSKNTKD